MSVFYMGVWKALEDSERLGSPIHTLRFLPSGPFGRRFVNLVVQASLSEGPKRQKVEADKHLWVYIGPLLSASYRAPWVLDWP